MSSRARPPRKGFAHASWPPEHRGRGAQASAGSGMRLPLPSEWGRSDGRVPARRRGWTSRGVTSSSNPAPHGRAALRAPGLPRRRGRRSPSSFWSSAPLRGGQGPAESQWALPARGLVSPRLPPAALLPGRAGPPPAGRGGPSRSPRRRAGSTQITGRELPAAWGGRLGAASQRLGSGVQARAAPLTQAGGGGVRAAPGPGRGGPPAGVLRTQRTSPGSPEPTPWAWPPGGAGRPCLRLEEKAPGWQLPGRGRAWGPGGATSYSPQGPTEPHPRHLERRERLIPSPGLSPLPPPPSPPPASPLPALMWPDRSRPYGSRSKPGFPHCRGRKRGPAGPRPGADGELGGA